MIKTFNMAGIMAGKYRFFIYQFLWFNVLETSPPLNKH